MRELSERDKDNLAAILDEEIAEGNSANDDNPFSSGIIMIKLVHTNRRLMK